MPRATAGAEAGLFLEVPAGGFSEASAAITSILGCAIDFSGLFGSGLPTATLDCVQ